MLHRVTMLLAVMLVAIPAQALDRVSKIMAQPDAPVTITSYSAAYQKGGTYTTEGIRHDVAYRNESAKPIVAVQIGLVSFVVWNEFLDRTGGVAIEDIAPGGSNTGAWVARAYADFSFMTGVAYVSKVRFADGALWSADLNAVAAELRKVEQAFDVAKLKEKPEK